MTKSEKIRTLGLHFEVGREVKAKEVKKARKMMKLMIVDWGLPWESCSSILKAKKEN